MPKISVVLPTFNGERWLAESIQSIIDQTEDDWELIVVDDASTDSSLKIAQDFASANPKIRVISNHKNSKLPASLNNGFALADGEYLTWTSDDNIYKPNALKKMSDYLDEHPNTDMVSMELDYIDEETKEVICGLVSDNSFKRRNVESLILSCNCGAAFMYRRAIAEKVGRYDEYAFCAEDYDYWCRIALAGRIDYTNDNIYQYRVNSKSLTVLQRPQVREKTRHIQSKYMQGFFDKYGFGYRDRAFVYFKTKQRAPLKYLPLMTYFHLHKLVVKIITMLIMSTVLRRKIRRAISLELNIGKQ